MTDAADDTFFWVKLLTAVVALVATFAHRWIAVRAAAYRLSFKRIAKAIVLDGPFVRRPSLEGELSAALKNEDSPTVLVYGPRGSGKTSFIHFALDGRAGVLAIDIYKKTHDEAQDELISNVSKEVDMFSREQDQYFLRDVFAACPVPPVVVVTLEAKCKGEVLEGVLVMCKSLSYNKRFQRQPRFIIDLSGSRAAIEASIRLEDLRAVGVQVGHFSDPEALLYVTDRLPGSLKDPQHRDSLARSVVQDFDGRVLTLKKVCEAIRKEHPTDISIVEATIENEKRKEEKWAARGWWSFCSSLAEKFGAPVSNENLKQAVERLLEGPQDKLQIIGILSKGSKDIVLSERDIGLFNADAGYHPLAFDPFESTISLSGSAIKAVLSRKIDKLGEPPTPEK